MTDQATPAPAPWFDRDDLLSARRCIAMLELSEAMAQWLANQQHWTDLPDDHVVLESRSTDGSDFRITAGMIREAAR